MQHIERDVADNGKISRGMVFTNSGGIFVKSDTEHSNEVKPNSQIFREFHYRTTQHPSAHAGNFDFFLVGII